MIRLGRFDPPEENRVELIRGEIVPIDGEGPMSPINPPHDDAVDELIDWTTEVLPRGAVRIRAQGSLAIPEHDSLPQPDFAWLAPRRHSKTRPNLGDVRLLVEVADSSLAKDRGEKARLYAEAGIRDDWIINLPGRCIEVRRNPVGESAQEVIVFVADQDVRPLAFPDVVLPASRLFPD